MFPISEEGGIFYLENFTSNYPGRDSETFFRRKNTLKDRI